VRTSCCIVALFSSLSLSVTMGQSKLSAEQFSPNNNAAEHITSRSDVSQLISDGSMTLPPLNANVSERNSNECGGIDSSSEDKTPVDMECDSFASPVQLIVTDSMKRFR
jgi:hypothetical protein